MDIFRGWNNYVERLEKKWRALITENDTVVIPGDISWALKLEETKTDLAFLDSLPGKKIIGKGNHDYWWCTKKKMDEFLSAQGFSSIAIQFNNAFAYKEYCICGSRGWSYDCPQSEYNVLLREAGRLKMSLEEGKKTGLEPIVFLHYPPVYYEYRCDEIISVLHEYNVKRCYFGHLHGHSHQRAVLGDFEGIRMSLISCDYINFMPQLIEL